MFHLLLLLYCMLRFKATKIQTKRGEQGSREIANYLFRYKITQERQSTIQSQKIYRDNRKSNLRTWEHIHVTCLSIIWHLFAFF